ncbi:hypothetical protein Tco_1102843 [Tanacetum coccineum]
MVKYYNKQVRLVSFKLGDHVMRKNEASKAIGQGKLAPNWEGPYIVPHPNENGFYLLTTPDGDDIPLACPASNLKRWSFNEFTWYKNKVLHIRIAAYSDQARPNQTFVSTSWRHPWDPILGITLVRMSMMANATPIVTTVTKTTNKEKASDAAPRVNIQDFCEEHYEDILPIIMEKARRDKRKEVQTRLNFGENSKRTRRERENSLNSRAENSPARFHPERSRTRGRERRDDRNVFSRLSHRRKSVHERLSDTYSGPGRTDSREPSHSRGHSHRGHSHIRERSQTEDRSRGTEESYGDTYSQGTTTKYRNRSRNVKK